MTVNKDLLTKAPAKPNNMYSTIFSYMRAHGYDGKKLSNEGIGHGVISLNGNSCAKRIEIVSSGNEPKIYAHVYDENDVVLYYAGMLETSPEAYATAAAHAGYFMELFNQYIDINFN